MSDDIRINLEPNVNGERTFFPGDTIRGNAELIVYKPRRMKEFYINIIGEATARWTTHGLNSTTNYIGTEPLIDFKITVVGDPNGPKFILAPGVYNCEYVYELPENIPYSLAVRGSTLSSKSGTITYRVEGVVDKPYKLSRCVGFEVIRNDDLNLYPQLKLPLECVKKKNFFFFFNKHKTLHMTVSIPYSGFTANQCIPITIDYKNESTIAIYQTVVSFIKVFNLVLPREGNPKIKKKETVLCRGSTVGVAARSSKSLKTELVVPKVLKSNDRFCYVVSISYLIEVVAEVDSEYRGNLKVRLPVTIGNVPIRFDDQLRNNNVQQSAASVPDNQYPPSFDEALWSLN